MKRLLDTHAFLWADGEPERLSAAAKAACEDQDSELLLSVVSVWEIQIKIQLGKLALRSGLREIMGAWVQRNNLRILPVNLEHVLRLECCLRTIKIRSIDFWLRKHKPKVAS